MKLQKALTISGPSPRGSGAAADAVEPVDADDLEIAEVERVVDMAHRVHVAPADRTISSWVSFLRSGMSMRMAFRVSLRSTPSSAASRCNWARKCATSACSRIWFAFSAAISPLLTASSGAAAAGGVRRLDPPAEQVRPARLARARRARQPQHQRLGLARGELVEKGLDRRDVGEAVQPLGAGAQLGRRLRAAQHQSARIATDWRARAARAAGCARSARRGCR